mmetsp:Transcript_17032/g.51318  ORF Transcript_17032/g.51318 Transcript_17032/m.51318 type:complete len:254 (-) Transcript_17032:1203-1964(-)
MNFCEPSSARRASLSLMYAFEKRSSNERWYSAKSTPCTDPSVLTTSSMYARRKANTSGSASASSTKTWSHNIAAYESAECDELSRRSFISSYGSTSAVSITSFGIASSQLGLPAEKESSMTHCRKGSAITGHSSMMPYSERSSSRCSFSVAGVMRSTIEFGKATSRSIHAARSGSTADAKSSVTARQTEPFMGMLSHDRTVRGPRPALRRRCKMVQMRPNAVRGWASPRAPPHSSMSCFTSGAVRSRDPSVQR